MEVYIVLRFDYIFWVRVQSRCSYRYKMPTGTVGTIVQIYIVILLYLHLIIFISLQTNFMIVDKIVHSNRSYPKFIIDSMKKEFKHKIISHVINSHVDEE